VFRYIQEKITSKGASEKLVQEFNQDEIILGRGGASQIILSGQRISPMHAKFSWVGGELVVADLGSLAGVRLNNRRVSSATVSSGDRVVLGDVQVRIEISEGIINLTESVASVSSASAGEGAERQLTQLRIENYLPKMSYLVFGVMTVCFVVAGLYPFAMGNFLPFNSGPISNSHALIAKDCQACHRTPFIPVQDSECTACHSMSEHAKNFEAFTSTHPNLSLRCGQCHMEHNGDHGLLLNDSQFCTSCHATMSTHASDTQVMNVVSINTHPQFRVSVENERGEIERVALDDSAKLKDGAQIKLNHSLHLQEGLRGRDGPVTLSCNSCHQLADNFRTIKPISFDAHCRDCHALTFDENMPDAQVPHGDAEAVYPALLTEYSKLIALGGGVLRREQEREDVGRMFPSTRPKDASSIVVRGSAVDNARNAERQLFTKTGCFLCHSYSEKDPTEKTEINSHFHVQEPRIPDVWLTKARFSHGAHEPFTCESCHEGTRNSTKTRDVLLPKVELCQQCHAEGKGPGYVESGCAECHSYHDALGFPDEKKQTIADYLHSLTR
jgi:hypothetical protein